MADTDSRISPGLWVAVALVCAVHLISARWHVRHGMLNADEGFYAIATRAVAQGEMPYRDFGFTQPPGVLYANALPLRIIGFGLFPQRALNGFWAALALGIAAVWLARRTRPAWGLGLALFFSLNAAWMYFIHLGKTYGFTTLLVMLAAWAFLQLPAGPKRNIVLSLLAAVGVGTRLPAAPFFGVLWLLTFWPGRRPTVAECTSSVAGLALATALVALPFWLAAPEAVKFWVVDFHRVSVPHREWGLSWQEFVAMAPAVWLLAGVAIAVALARRRPLTRETGLLLATVVTLAANVLPRGVYDEYSVPFLLPLAVAAAALVYDECGKRNLLLVTVLVLFLVIAQVITAPLAGGAELWAGRPLPSWWLPPKSLPYKPALPEELAQARELVRRFLSKDAPFIGSNIILAAETGHTVPRELRMGPFSFTNEMSAEQAARLHLVTQPQLDAWFTRPDVTVIAFFQRRGLDYGWSMPSFRELPPEVQSQWFDPLFRNFEIEERGNFVLLLRKSPAPAR